MVEIEKMKYILLKIQQEFADFSNLKLKFSQLYLNTFWF